MATNRGVVYLKPGCVEVQKIDFPTFRNPAGVANKFVIDPHRQLPRVA
jgi:hypothetical protein